MRIGRKAFVPSPSPTPSAEVLALRSSWKWAYLSHFLFIYNPTLHLEDVQLSVLEDDLASGTYSVIPIVMQRLLTSLTPHDKRMILEDWQQQLRKQSLRRSSRGDSLMGTEDAPVDFRSLTMFEKLELFYCACEWHFHNPNSLRTRMRDDDEYANWRIQPIAYDAKGAAYWLLGGSRLWKQQPLQQKAISKTNKRKRVTSKTHTITTVINGRTSRGKQNSFESSSPSHKTAVVRSKAISMPRSPSVTLPQRPVRDTRSQIAGLPSTRPRIVGIRASSRLRGKEEEWQQIPEEWLKENNAETSETSGTKKNNGNFKRKGDEDEENKEEEQCNVLELIDDGSELTSLSDLSQLSEEEKDQSVVDHDENDDAEHQESSLSLEHSTYADEIWETVCITLNDWEEFTKQFETSTSSKEKAFYKLLVNDIVPVIAELLKVDTKKQVMEDALVQRKRSSRLAIKESLREAERIESRKRAETAKELERHKRWEARVQKEEEERLKLKSMRSARLKEKAGIFVDTASNSHETNIPATAASEMTHNVSADTEITSNEASITHLKQGSISNSGIQTPKEDEHWELNCEVCHRRGWKLDDGQELMCCERCSQWQHIRCHDQADFIAGRPRRDWESEEFLCNACKTFTDKQRNYLHERQSRPSVTPHPHLHLQLRPLPQHQDTLHPQQPHVSSQHRVEYGGSAGENSKNGKPTPDDNDTVPGAPKGKTKANGPYSKALEPIVPTSTPVCGHPHPYHHTGRHQPLISGNYSLLPTIGVSPNSQPHQSIARNVPFTPSPSDKALVSSSGPSYSSNTNIYLSNHSSHRPASVNSQSNFSQDPPIHWATSNPLSTDRDHGTPSPGWPLQCPET